MENNKGNIWWAVLGFCFPIVGLILFVVWKNSDPANAKMAGKGALIAVVVKFVAGIAMFAITACSAASFMTGVADSVSAVISL